MIALVLLVLVKAEEVTTETGLPSSIELQGLQLQGPEGGALKDDGNDAPLPDGWTKLFDPSTTAYYYVGI